ncbi:MULTISPECIES: hypothetical protein [unclassified Aurantimonas]|uniref:hypothetical protein n=1 Tax=unclassified Aurantimonas TaxID=2638230 RepID=UPI002E197F58|nr:MULTISPECIES: hypothetical protein [unclassified Aurantimonas]MEC5289423.1 hypothetical protein [Aurantimonas sp. C2-3-R2]MEC5410503.1 hypothetical protein [Aurantimonas sp. C2-4-R8]
MNMFDLSPPADEDGAIVAMKWMIAVMDRDDKSLHFVASVLSSCCKYGGLTERQADAVEKTYERILKAFEAGALEIQGGHISVDGPTNVTHLRPRGAA